MMSPTRTTGRSAGLPSTTPVTSSPYVCVRPARCRSGKATADELMPRKPCGAALQHHRCPMRPRERRRDHDRRAADVRAGDHAECAALAVDQRAAGQRAVRRLRDADDAIELTRAARAQRPADNGDVGQRRHDAAAPRAADRDGEVADARLGGRHERRAAQVRSREPRQGSHRNARPSTAPSWVAPPATPHRRHVVVQHVRGREHEIGGEHDAGRGAAVAVDLDDRRGGAFHGVGESVRRAEENVSLMPSR